MCAVVDRGIGGWKPSLLPGGRCGAGPRGRLSAASSGKKARFGWQSSTCGMQNDWFAAEAGRDAGSDDHDRGGTDLLCPFEFFPIDSIAAKYRETGFGVVTVIAYALSASFSSRCASRS